MWYHRIIFLCLILFSVYSCKEDAQPFQERAVKFDVISYEILQPAPEEVGVRIIKNRDQYINFFGEVPIGINFGEEMIITFTSEVRSISIDYRVSNFIEQENNLFLGFDIFDCNDCSRNWQSKLLVIKAERIDKVTYFDFNTRQPRD